jgi:hypothetical protein
MDRQRIVGWVLIVVSTVYIAYFLRVKAFSPGPILEKKDWVQFIGTIVTLMIGTANVRLAAIRAEKRKQNRKPDSSV